MKHLLRPVPLLIFIVMLLAGLGLLYWQTELDASLSSEPIKQNLRQLEALDSEWNVQVWRNKDVISVAGELSSYSDKLFKLHREMEQQVVPLHDNALNQSGSDLKKQIEAKRILIESFKMQNLNLQTSLKRLSTAESELQQRLEEEKFKKLSRASALNALHELTDTLLSETLKYNLTPNDELRGSVANSIAYVNSSKANYPAEVVTQLDAFLVQVQDILVEKDLGVSLLDSISKLNVTPYTQQIEARLNLSNRAKIQHQQHFQNYLFLYAAVLLLLLSYTVYQLFRSVRATHRANKALNDSNSSLEEKVHNRTQMISHAMSELKESQVQLVQAEKMATLGQMVAGVTHEINTPLAYLKSSLEISLSRINDIAELINENSILNTMLRSGEVNETDLARQLERVSAVAESLAQADVANELEGLLKDGLYGITQIHELVIGLKNFSRLDREKIAQASVNEGLESTLKIARNVVKNKKIVKQYGDVPHITCSPSSINQVFLNLISNAAQATGEDGEIRLITSHNEQHVKIEIVDNGSGINKHDLKKIFEPFFTTKKIGEGTGLGLSIVQRIIREHGGTINVHSELGMGTKFTILLPLAFTPDGAML